MNTIFRFATHNELPHILEMVRDFHLYEHLSYDKDIIHKILTDLTSNTSLGQLWVAVSESELIGYAVVGHGYSIEYGGRDAFIDEIYLSPKFRKKGISTKLLDTIRETSKTLGISVIHLEVDNTNSQAFDVYCKYGFKPKDRKMMSYWMD